MGEGKHRETCKPESPPLYYQKRVDSTNPNCASVVDFGLNPSHSERILGPCSGPCNGLIMKRLNTYASWIHRAELCRTCFFRANPARRRQRRRAGADHARSPAQ
ncbi:jg26187 [Pararge aegeria aegeria]|uniref:Jg26187 protein n=1 Tax=Pararge aegeria aegeria TaxID=348720 RepID=A0A8S4QWS2_9NEOP|nr:jg26187 [Pararge aegeria aegeria]